MTYQCDRCSEKKTEVIPKLQDTDNASGQDSGNGGLTAANPFGDGTQESGNGDTGTQDSGNTGKQDDGDGETVKQDTGTQNSGTDGSVVKAGYVFTDKTSNAKYEFVKASDGTFSVEYKAPTNKNAKSVVIPATVKLNGVSYKVTSVAAGAFKNNKKLISVTIGKNVTKIGQKAFYKCTKLKTVTIKSKKLKSIGSSAFKGIAKNSKIKIPKSKYSKYKKLLRKKYTVGRTSLKKVK
jgi:hypothetical protein